MAGTPEMKPRRWMDLVLAESRHHEVKMPWARAPKAENAGTRTENPTDAG
ncbi:hypothetical protein HKCCE2091_08065 [Rhodobacterales bacterium HKCCE2091]|nr:hypothetical protein [Rhodobacterales bacterium HKCCE2091]